MVASRGSNDKIYPSRILKHKNYTSSGSFSHGNPKLALPGYTVPQFKSILSIKLFRCNWGNTWSRSIHKSINTLALCLKIELAFQVNYYIHYINQLYGKTKNKYIQLESYFR